MGRAGGAREESRKDERGVTIFRTFRHVLWWSDWKHVIHQMGAQKKKCSRGGERGKNQQEQTEGDLGKVGKGEQARVSRRKRGGAE